MKLVGKNKGFKVFFDCTNQVYNVFKDNKFLIGNKFRFRDVKCYLD